MSGQIFAAFSSPLSEQDPNQAGWQSSTIFVLDDAGGGDDWRSIISFDVTSLQALTLSAATLNARALGSGATTDILASRILRTVNVQVATWNKHNTTDSWTTAGCGDDGTDFTSANAVSTAFPDPLEWQTWNIKDQLDDALTAGNAYLVRLLAESASTEAWYTGKPGSHIPYLLISGSLTDAPTDLAATLGANGLLTLTWTKSAGATGYEIFQGGVTAPTRMVDTVGDVATWSTYLVPGTYYFRIRGISSVGWDESPYTASISETVTTSPLFSLDFGNGIVAGGKSSDTYRVFGHSGLEYPIVEQKANENAILDGGVLGSQRGAMRRMTVALDLGPNVTRREAALLFSPGVLRTMTSPLGTIDYKVEDFDHFEQNLTGDTLVSVTMLSEMAYPLGNEVLQLVPAGFATIESDSEVPCAPVITVTVPIVSSDLVITSDAGTTTITDPLDFAVDDEVVIDSENFTVTVNDVDKIAWFDRDGVWPTLPVDDSEVTAKADGTYCDFDIQWRPRLLGLVV